MHKNPNQSSHKQSHIKTSEPFPDFHEFFIENLKKHPEDIDEYLNVALEDYDAEKNTAALLLALRTIAEAKDGLLLLSQKTKLTKQALSKVLSPQGNPRLETLCSILHALGYTLSIRPRL